MGLIRFSVSEVTMLVNAPPMITPIAMSITLPRSAKALNSSINFFNIYTSYFFIINSISDGFHPVKINADKKGENSTWKTNWF